MSQKEENTKSQIVQRGFSMSKFKKEYTALADAIITSSIPESANASMKYSVQGLSNMGNMGFGQLLVKGLSRVPLPPTIMTA